MRLLRFIPILVFMACGKAEHRSPPPPGSPESPIASRADRLEAQALDFTLIQAEVLPKCATSCHLSTSLIDLQDFAGVKGNLSDVKSSVFGTGMPMPPRSQPQLTMCEKRLLKLWIDAGAPEETTVLVGRLDECLVN